MRSLLFALAVIVLFPRGNAGQTASTDIKSVVASGKVSGNRYQNDFFGLTLTAEDGVMEAPSLVNADAQRARLVDASSIAKDGDGRYSVGVLVDSLAKNPLIHSPDQYIRAVRHQLEKTGLETVREEFPTEVSGVQFVGATMKASIAGHTYFRGLYGTFLNGYILSLDVKAVSPERLQKTLSTIVRFNLDK